MTQSKKATSNESVIFEKRLVTPEMASQLLSRNINNRTMRKNHVSTLLQDMKNGQFELNGDTIRLDSQGNLLDGQHRLQALVEYGKPLYMGFAIGISSRARKTMDIGRKRNIADGWTLDGYIQDAVIAVPIATLLVHALTEDYGTTPSNLQLRLVVDGLRADFEWGLNAIVGKKRKFPAFITGAFIVAHADPNFCVEVELILAKYKEGSDLKRLSAPWMLNEMSTQKGSLSNVSMRVETLYRYMNVIYAGCQHKQIHQARRSLEARDYFFRNLEDIRICLNKTKL